jgi:hypothetical protein
VAGSISGRLIFPLFRSVCEGEKILLFGHRGKSKLPLIGKKN